MLGGKEAISFLLVCEAKHILERIVDLHLIRKLFHLPAWHLCEALHNTDQVHGRWGRHHFVYIQKQDKISTSGAISISKGIIWIIPVWDI